MHAVSRIMVLDKNDEAQLASYRGLVKCPDDGALLAEVRSVVSQELALGNDRCKEEVASILECNTHLRSVGRPWKK